ncbi:hypothetical protein BJV82DRAFT_661892 [Fennellomyces sp. T-0311]|nr:hypothetical protein BJV82DRAFT_661892 [Fennellomyces sp. T-0311]
MSTSYNREYEQHAPPESTVGITELEEVLGNLSDLGAQAEQDLPEEQRIPVDKYALLDIKIEEFIKAMGENHHYSREEVIERFGGKVARFWKSVNARSTWHQFLHEHKGDATGETGRPTNSLNNLQPTNALATMYKELPASQYNELVERTKRYNEENHLEGVVEAPQPPEEPQRDMHDKRPQVSNRVENAVRECISRMKEDVRFLQKRCGIETAILLSSQFFINELKTKSAFGSKLGGYFIVTMQEAYKGEIDHPLYKELREQEGGLIEKFDFYCFAARTGLLNPQRGIEAQTPALPQAPPPSKKRKSSGDEALPEGRKKKAVPWKKLREGKEPDVLLVWPWPIAVFPAFADPSGEPGFNGLGISQLDKVLEAIEKKQIKFTKRR